ncbi:MAG: pyridoxamine 5'-phosphate oxidase family protein [Gaiellaceae bacterium]
MAKTFAEIDARLAEFVGAQKLFFVATAPLAPDGHVNVSPKGDAAGCFRVLGPETVAYLDLTGSGAETIAHLRENGRICVMFCAFDGPPRIVRFHGCGEAVLSTDAGFDAAIAPFEPLGETEEAGRRAVIRIDVDRVSDSCGYGVPRYDYAGERDQMPRWIANKGREGILAYQGEKNAASLDGLRALGQ